MKKEIATFAAGCFWGIQLTFSETKGVISTVVGYIGGKIKNPTYEQVCLDRTGHAEAVQITFDSSKISYKQLLDIFWEAHDPTTMNRQGPDVGTQYRSSIFYHNEEQKKEALESKREWQKKLGNKIVTKIIKADEFYLAEEYHQNYLKKTGRNICH